MQRNDARGGFTLVELLVVIAIIGTLMGLLLPAVQSARESGRRANCMSNQSQITRAMIRFDETARFLPGWKNSIPFGSGTTTTVSWPVVIMPYMERMDIWRSWTGGSSPAPYLAMYVCQSSPPPSMTLPTLAYAGNCGSATNANKFDGVMFDSTSATPFAVSVFKISQADGTTNTLLVSEKCNSGTAGLIMTSWNVTPTGSNSFTFSNSATAVPGFGITSSIATKVINNSILGTGNTTPGLISMPSSNHPGGVIAGFADGRVTFLKDSLASMVYAQLLSWDHSQASATSIGSGGWRAQEKPIISDGDYQ